jgi:hypothetical protein
MADDRYVWAARKLSIDMVAEDDWPTSRHEYDAIGEELLESVCVKSYEDKTCAAALLISGGLADSLSRQRLLLDEGEVYGEPDEAAGYMILLVDTTLDRALMISQLIGGIAFAFADGKSGFSIVTDGQTNSVTIEKDEKEGIVMFDEPKAVETLLSPRAAIGPTH